MKPVDIYFLHHSGFVLELEKVILVFDYYLDPLKRLEERLEKTDKPVYFFVSHVHGDHFNRAIRSFEDRASGYFLHRDCSLTLGNQSRSPMPAVLTWWKRRDSGFSTPGT